MVKKMKRILIFSHALEIGGAERALLGLLNSIDTEKYKVDLFLMRHEGELLQYIPPNINLLPEIKAYTCLAVPIKNVIQKGKVGIILGRVLGKIKAKQFGKKEGISDTGAVELEYSHKYTIPFMPNVGNGVYDLAISYLTPHYFIAEKVSAKQKIAWIHTDYSYIDVDVTSENKMWGKYDKIASISPAVAKSFLSKFPELTTKIVEIENIISPEFIKQQAEEFEVISEMPEDGIVKLLSIGRFCEQKNFDNIPDICKQIVEKGMNIHWYIIGFGSDEDLIRKKIAEAGMQDNVIVLGKKSNPYPYIKACDAYIQPSRYEGKAVTVREAQILGKPVIITNYATACSQLSDMVDGIIVPLNNRECANAIYNVFNTPGIINHIISQCRKTDYTNSDEVEKIYQLVEY